MSVILAIEWYTRWGIILGILALRYFIVAGIFFAIFYVIRKKYWTHRRIQQRDHKDQQYWQEIKYSLMTMFIFSVIAISILSFKAYTRIYHDISLYGWGYLFLSFVLMVLIHDTYFYWTHRLMHHPRLYRVMHRTHHLSHNPSPWAAFSFHPLEAIVEAGIFPILVFTLPLHPLAIFTFLLFMMTLNVIGHLGYEIYPKHWTRHWLGRWQNTSTHHNMHHELVKGNYGLYFNWWDKWMGTNHERYLDRFDEITTQAKKPVQ
jgi:sterol desaturase/sphingolipid hydroxylase (fatty acid hydroxylase superfamily)